MAAFNDDTVLQIVHQWPPQQRFALIRDLLDSLEPASAKAATLPRAVGLLVTTQPPPDDETVKTWLNERCVEKYGA